MSIKNIKNPLLRNRIQKLNEIDQSIIDNSHTHSNKNTLDNVTQTIIDNSHIQNTDYKIESAIYNASVIDNTVIVGSKSDYYHAFTIVADNTYTLDKVAINVDVLSLLFADIVLDIIENPSELQQLADYYNDSLIANPYYRKQNIAITPGLNEIELNTQLVSGNTYTFVLYSEANKFSSKSLIQLVISNNSGSIAYRAALNVGNRKLVLTSNLADNNIFFSATGTIVKSKVECKNGEVEFSGDLIINGDIKQNGAIYETHAEQIYTEKDTIIMREGAISALGSNEKSGFKILKYNNIDNSIFGVGNDGYARVGDEGGTLQRLATIEENPADTKFVYYDAPTKSLKTGDVPGGKTLIVDYTLTTSESSLSFSNLNIPIGSNIFISYFLNTVNSSNQNQADAVIMKINNDSGNNYRSDNYPPSTGFTPATARSFGYITGIVDVFVKLVSSVQTQRVDNSYYSSFKNLLYTGSYSDIDVISFQPFNGTNKIQYGGSVKIYIS